MSETAKPKSNSTITDWLAQPQAARLELFAGTFVQKALPDFRHAAAQFGLATILRPRFHRRGGGDHPGGWWIVGEVDIQLGDDGFRPDLAGWRRDRAPEPPQGRPITLRPDWVCETLSRSNASNETILKMWRYHNAGVPHYWIVDPDTQTLAVYRNSAEGYVNVMVVQAHEHVRAEPFDAIEFNVGLLFGADLDDVT